MNDYLSGGDSTVSTRSIDEYATTEGEKMPKIFGSNEFAWLFNYILKQVRHHRPSIIVIAYDFTLTKAHNHMYNLKPDVLGYFLYMLS